MVLVTEWDRLFWSKTLSGIVSHHWNHPDAQGYENANARDQDERRCHEQIRPWAEYRRHQYALATVPCRLHDADSHDERRSRANDDRKHIRTHVGSKVAFRGGNRCVRLQSNVVFTALLDICWRRHSGLQHASDFGKIDADGA